MDYDSDYKNFLISSFVEYVQPKITKLQSEQNIDADAATQLIGDAYKNVKNLKLPQVNLLQV